MTTLDLSSVNADFDSLVDQLQTHLSTKDSWSGFLTTQTGETILEMIAAVGALDQAKLLRYHQDSFPFTALSDTAVYALAAMQGVRINRKLPMSVEVSLSSPDGAVSVAELTQFNLAGQLFFNREAITIGTSAATYTLYEGTIVSTEVSGLNASYQSFVSREGGFQISDVDVRVDLNGVQLEKNYDGIWKLKDRDGYRERTLPNGKLMIEFGNDVYGTKPTTNDVVTIIYALTRGLDLSTTRTVTKAVTCDTFPSIKGSATSNPTGGGDQASPDLYRTLSAATFGTFGSAVTKQQYLGVALSYPGVVDVITQAQREVNPNAVEWMNTVRLVTLTQNVWSDTDKESFIEYMNQRCMYSTNFYMAEPAYHRVTVNITVYCYQWANAAQCELDARNAIIDLFKKRPGILGLDIFRSDIHKAALDSNKGIEYAVLHLPTSDLIVSGQPMAKPTAQVFGTLGSLPPGTYYYAVSPVLASGGEIAPRNYQVVTNNAANSAIELNWEEYADADSYRIWGRSSSQIGLLATVGSGVFEFTDDGSATPSISTPAVSTAPVRYNDLALLTVYAEYSNRSSSRGEVV